MCLCDLKIGEKAIINKLLGDSNLNKGLSVLGFIKGTEVKLSRIAPLGDPITINLRGFDLAIKKMIKSHF